MKHHGSERGGIKNKAYTDRIAKLMAENSELKEKERKSHELTAEANKKTETLNAELNKLKEENATKGKW